MKTSRCRLTVVAAFLALLPLHARRTLVFSSNSDLGAIAMSSLPPLNLIFDPPLPSILFVYTFLPRVCVCCLWWCGGCGLVGLVRLRSSLILCSALRLLLAAAICSSPPQLFIPSLPTQDCADLNPTTQQRQKAVTRHGTQDATRSSKRRSESLLAHQSSSSPHPHSCSVHDRSRNRTS